MLLPNQNETQFFFIFSGYQYNNSTSRKWKKKTNIWPVDCFIYKIWVDLLNEAVTIYFKISFVLRKTGLPVIEIKWLKKNPEKLKKRQLWQMKASMVKTKKDWDSLQKTHLKVRLTLNFSKKFYVFHTMENSPS